MTTLQYPDSEITLDALDQIIPQNLVANGTRSCRMINHLSSIYAPNNLPGAMPNNLL